MFLRRIPRPIINLLLLFGSQLLAWFFVAEHLRYMVYLLPLGAVIAGLWMERSDRSPGSSRRRGSRTARNLRGSSQRSVTPWC